MHLLKIAGDSIKSVELFGSKVRYLLRTLGLPSGYGRYFYKVLHVSFCKSKNTCYVYDELFFLSIFILDEFNKVLFTYLVLNFKY